MTTVEKEDQIQTSQHPGATGYQVRPTDDGAAGAAALGEVLARATPEAAPDILEDADLRALWKVITDGSWHLLGAPEESGGFDLGLRDLTEIARVAGRQGLPAPLTQTLAVVAHGDGSPGDQPRAVTVPRRRGGSARVVHGAFPGVPGVAGAAHDSGTPASAGFAPTLRIVESAGDVAPLAPELRRRLVVLWTAESVGAAERLLDEAVDYAGVRVQFGRPIGSFQAIKHLLADAALAVQEATTAVVWAANAPEVPIAGIRLALDRCVTISESAGQAHGGIGMTWELGHHFLTRHIIALRDLVEDLLALEGEPR